MFHIIWMLVISIAACLMGVMNLVFLRNMERAAREIDLHDRLQARINQLDRL